MKLVIHFYILLILLIGLVSALPPTQTAVNLVVGLDIEHPAVETIQYQENYTFDFHVFNKTTGLLMTNTTTSCNFHLYDINGNHIYINPSIPFTLNKDFEIKVNASNFSYVGDYYYYIFCNTSTLGGYTAAAFRTTDSGRKLETGDSIFLGIIVILFIVGSLLLITEQRKEKISFPSRLTLILGSYFFFLISLNIISLVVTDMIMTQSLVAFFDSFLSIGFIVFYGASVLVLIVWIITFIQTLLLYKSNLKEQRLFG